jgi:cation transport ATPase
MAQHLEVGHVKAELLPEERGAEVARLSTAGSGVAAVGYLPRDELALGASSVRVMLGAAGAPGADSGVALTSSDVRDAAAGLWIARACRDVVQRGLMVVLLGGGVLVGLGVAGLVNPWVLVLLGACIDGVVQPAAIGLRRRIELRVPRHS